MKRVLLVALLASVLAGCDDFPFHDEGWHGRGWEHGRGHGDHERDFRSAD